MRQSSTELNATVEELKCVTKAYISIALKHPTEEHTKGRCSFKQMGLDKEITAITGKTRVPVLTVPVEMQPDGRYGELPYVRKVVPEVDFVGGVNMPKKMSVIDSFNQVRCQLLLVPASTTQPHTNDHSVSLYPNRIQWKIYSVQDICTKTWWKHEQLKIKFE